jgi:hypothetical protein
MPQNAPECFMTSIHSQKVLKMLNDRLLAAYERYYGDLKVGDMSPEEFIKTYGRIEDRVNGNLKVGVMLPEESTSTFSTNSTNAARSSKSSKDSQNVA